MKKPSNKLKQAVLDHIMKDSKIKLSIIRPLPIKNWPMYALIIFGVVSIIILSTKMKWGNLEETLIAAAMLSLLIASFGFLTIVHIVKKAHKSVTNRR